MERTIEQWKHEIAEDQGLVREHVEEALSGDHPDAARCWALALKEARRMEADLYRMASVVGVERAAIDAVRGL
jgi:hypothetical protein